MFLKTLSTLLSGQNKIQPILVNSIPKSGTNLLKNIVLAIPGMSSDIDLSLANETTSEEECMEYLREKVSKFSPGHVYTGHIPYHPEVSFWLHKNKVKQLFIYRDPRDVTVSFYHYIMNKTPKHAYYDMYSSFESDHVRLLNTIKGFGEGKKKFKVSNDSIPAIGIVYKSYLPWLEDSNCYSIKYEDLMISESRSLEEIKGIIEFISPKTIINNMMLEEIRDSGMDTSKSHTFRKGKINSWKEEYTENHVNTFRLNFDNKLLNELGYGWDGSYR